MPASKTLKRLVNWSEREDSNLRPLRPERRLFPREPARSRVFGVNYRETHGEQAGNRGERSRTEIAQLTKGPSGPGAALTTQQHKV
jgi:hypothetical protein